jgi:hypothetical protein
MKRILLAVSMAAVVSAVDAEPTNAPYTADAGPRAGNYEATLSGAGLSDDEFKESNIGVSGSLGYYYSKNVLFTLKQGLFSNDTGDSTLINARSIFQTAYQWDLDKWQPYVGLNVGAIYGAGIHDDAIFGPEVGLKYFVNESTFVYGNIAYEVPFDECCKDGVVPYALGIGFNF